jgi:hypothetical protein
VRGVIGGNGEDARFAICSRSPVARGVVGIGVRSEGYVLAGRPERVLGAFSGSVYRKPRKTAERRSSALLVTDAGRLNKRCPDCQSQVKDL